MPSAQVELSGEPSHNFCARRSLIWQAMHTRSCSRSRAAKCCTRARAPRGSLFAQLIDLISFISYDAAQWTQESEPNRLRKHSFWQATAASWVVVSANRKQYFSWKWHGIMMTADMWFWTSWWLYHNKRFLFWNFNLVSHEIKRASAVITRPMIYTGPILTNLKSSQSQHNFRNEYLSIILRIDGQEMIIMKRSIIL